MSRLERRYRLLLRTLPAGYRKRWGEEMTATFLDAELAGPDPDLRAEYGSPGWAEIAAVLRLAVVLRLSPHSADRRVARRGEAIGAAAVCLVLVQAVVGLLGAVSLLWAAQRFPLQVEARPPELWASAASDLVWVGAFVALLLGRPRTARGFGVLAVVFSIVSFVLAPGWTAAAFALLAAATVLGLGAIRRPGDESGVDPVRHRSLLVAVGVGAVGVTAVLAAVARALGIDWAAVIGLLTLALAVLLSLRTALAAALACATEGVAQTLGLAGLLSAEGLPAQFVAARIAVTGALLLGAVVLLAIDRARVPAKGQAVRP
ncbi:hypothetical protein ACL02T_09825 [Pseudonocardia sp. RS010]|uniref:hypothetical protein n=1 Tax=Pseudonocardia sp. RS010 TaxID=3385979 RepID=UPI0039A2AABC